MGFLSLILEKCVDESFSEKAFAYFFTGEVKYFEENK